MNEQQIKKKGIQKNIVKVAKAPRPEIDAADEALRQELAAATKSASFTAAQVKKTVLYGIIRGESCGKYYDTRPKKLYLEMDRAVEEFWRDQLSPNSSHSYQTFLVDFWEQIATDKEKFEVCKPMFPFYHAQYESICKITADSIAALPSENEKIREAEQLVLVKLQEDLIDSLENKLFDYLHAIKAVLQQYQVLMLFKSTKAYCALVDESIDTFTLIE